MGSTVRSRLSTLITVAVGVVVPQTTTAAIPSVDEPIPGSGALPG